MASLSREQEEEIKVRRGSAVARGAGSVAPPRARVADQRRHVPPRGGIRAQKVFADYDQDGSGSIGALRRRQRALFASGTALTSLARRAQT